MNLGQHFQNMCAQTTVTYEIKMAMSKLFIEQDQGYLSCNVVPSKKQLKTAILDNKESSKGFLMWISTYCISCGFQWHAKQKMSYHVFVYNGSEPKICIESIFRCRFCY